MSKVDLRIVGVVIALCVSIFFAWIADKAVFESEPRTHLQAVLAYVAVLGHALSGDRVITFAISTTTFFAVLVVVGLGIFMFLEIYVLEPLVIKWKMRYVRREKKWMNEYDDGTL